jgi:predicted dithiol-disulfide oxidoreductase (DUF899 family)
MNSTAAEIAHPPIATQAEWLAARKELLAEEKAHTKEYDRINAKRRRLPMVKVEKEYRFTGPDGEKTLEDLFDGQTQLIVYHFMYGPDDTPCPGCTSYVDAIGDLSTLSERNTSMVLVSRGPYEKLAAYQEEKGWTIPWYSSADSDFNYDYEVTLDPSRGPVRYNYKSREDKEWLAKIDKPIEMPGTSVFFRIGHDIYHTYSTFERGGEALCDSYRLLDITPYGRQEDFEDSPEGWPQKPTYG